MLLDILKVSKMYDEHIALHDFSVTMSEGIYGLLGPNGAGKTTLINIITANMKPTVGKVLYEGNDIFNMGENYREKLGYMPQSQTVYNSFTAIQFLTYIAALKGVKGKMVHNEILSLLQKVDLKQVGRKRIGTYSVGMKQRLLIAQALLGDPEILILDEPTAGLAPEQRLNVKNMISELSYKKIVLLATHIVSDVESIANNIIFINNGKLVCSDSTDILLSGLEGKVFEIETDEAGLLKLGNQYKTGSVTRQGKKLFVRVISDVMPKAQKGYCVRPVLEDVYIWKCVKNNG